MPPQSIDATALRQKGCLLYGMMLVEEGVLGCKHSLARHVVGIHPFPSAGQCATMENHLNAEVVGIREDVLVELHGVLLVAGKEIHLDALHTDTLQPSHLLAAGEGGVHALLGSLRSVAPCAVAVIP